MALLRMPFNGTRWRLLNAIHAARPRQLRAANLLSEQDAADEDLLWHAECELVTATIFGNSTPIDLVDHLTHDGSTMVIGLRLNHRGRATVAYPANKVLRHLGEQTGRRAALGSVLAATGADVDAVASLNNRRLVTITHRAGTDPIHSDDLPRLPIKDLIVRLTDKGRLYLPLSPP